MAEPRPNWLPAATVRNQLQGLATLGLDMRRLGAAVGPLPMARMRWCRARPI